MEYKNRRVIDGKVWHKPPCEHVYLHEGNWYFRDEVVETCPCCGALCITDADDEWWEK